MKLLGLLLSTMILTLFSATNPYQAQPDTGTTRAAYQLYENGAMIWREDTGAITVLSDRGNTALTIPEAAYAPLPDNADLNAPEGRVAPISGFGRVWAGVEGVRESVGWALREEVSYQATFRLAGYSGSGLQQISVNRPDGSRVVIRADGTWGRFGLPREIHTLPAQTTFTASWQAYEGGYLMWWGETGSVWVLRDSGSTEVINSQAYGTLPENTQIAPRGLITPIMGFGRVWANYLDVQRDLGWATAEEEAYELTFERAVRLSAVGGSAVNFIVSTPSGRHITLYDNATWVFID